MLKVLSCVVAVGAALCVCAGANADEESTIARLIAFEVDVTSADGLLRKQRADIGAIFEFEELTCPYNSDGGMVTKIVNQAMATVIAPDDFEISFVAADGHGDDLASARSRPEFSAFRDQREKLMADRLASHDNVLTFPWYRPNCDAPALLTDHTRNLCENYRWSEPLYGVLIGTYLRPDFEREPQSHRAIYGATICQSGEELPRMLRERGVSDLNARLIKGDTPRACFDMLLSGEADVAIMPLLTGNRLQRDFAEFEDIRSAFKLDIEMTVHAISPAEDAQGVDHIRALNRGVANIRESGVWEGIVNEFFAGHDHDASYREAHAQ